MTAVPDERVRGIVVRREWESGLRHPVMTATSSGQGSAKSDHRYATVTDM